MHARSHAIATLFVVLTGCSTTNDDSQGATDEEALHHCRRVACDAGADAGSGTDADAGSDTGADAANDAGAEDASSPPDTSVPDDSTGGTTCTLQDSGPLAATADGQIFENLRITSTSGTALAINGYANVIVRNCEIDHRGGPGIAFSNASNLRIENTVVVNNGAPASGPNPSADWNNISGESSTGVVIDHVRLIRGSSGIYLLSSPAAHLSFVEGHDFRGPMPRGQLVQFDKSDGAILEDFSSENGSTSWTEDNVSVYQSSNVTVQRGLVDGNNSPSGVGVMFEETGNGATGGLAIDVDAIHQGNGCFSAYPGYGVTFQRTRSRDNICTDQGRGLPSSGGLAWAGSPSSSNLQILASSYFNLCADLVWDQSVFTTVELTSEDFVPRAPLRLTFCWNAP